MLKELRRTGLGGRVSDITAGNAANSNSGPHARGMLITTLGVIVLSPDTLLLRLIETDGMTILVWRGLLMGLTLLAYLALRHRGGVVGEFRRIGRWGLVAAVLFAVNSLFFVTSVMLTTVANTLLIISAAPLFAALWSWLFLREQVRSRTWAAIAAGFAGMLIIFGGSLGGGSLVGDLCAVGTACFLAGNLTVLRHVRAINMLPALALAGFLFALAALPFAGELALSARDTVLLVLLGVVIVPLSFALITTGPRYLPAAEVSLIMLLEAILGPLWVWLVIGEVPPAATFAGGAVILATLAIHSLAALRSGETEPA